MCVSPSHPSNTVFRSKNGELFQSAATFYTPTKNKYYLFTRPGLWNNGVRDIPRFVFQRYPQSIMYELIWMDQYQHTYFPKLWWYYLYYFGSSSFYFRQNNIEWLLVKEIHKLHKYFNFKSSIENVLRVYQSIYEQHMETWL